MYTSCLHFERTSEEFKDQEASWKRSDKAFFAAGACHILAFTFVELANDPDLQIIFIKPAEAFGNIGTHVYVKKGEWAFDYSGWTKESELLAETAKDYAAAHLGWEYTTVVIESDLKTFCLDHNHRLPEKFAHDPTKRAKKFIQKYTMHPNVV